MVEAESGAFGEREELGECLLSRAVEVEEVREIAAALLGVVEGEELVAHYPVGFEG